MIVNRINHYLELPPEQFRSVLSGTDRRSMATIAPTTCGPLSELDINRIAWEQARQMVAAKRQLRNRIARFL